jgi:hypothetical protein
MSSCGAYYHEFSESSSACLLKGKCPFSLTNAIELLLKASAEWLCLGAPRLRVTHEHYCCAATFQATPVLRELANTSKPKHGLIPIRCCFKCHRIEASVERMFGRPENQPVNRNPL